MEIKIETTFIPLILAYDDFPEGVQIIRHQPAMERRNVDYSALATGILIFASNVSAGILAAWIYDKIKRVKDKPSFLIKINDKTVHQLDEKSITEIIEREIEISRK
ncbi:MAG: hypothetical protein WCW53_07355 [Syntrophales bacterium]